MNTKIKNLNNLKTLPLIAALAIGLALSPTISMADKGDRGGHKNKYSHDDRQSHSKGHKRSTHGNKRHYKSRDNRHKSSHGYRSKHRYNKGHGHNNDHAHYKRDHHHTTYVVNDRHYSDYSYALDPLRFMIGLHTNNIDIIFRD